MNHVEIVFEKESAIFHDGDHVTGMVLINNDDDLAYKCERSSHTLFNVFSVSLFFQHFIININVTLNSILLISCIVCYVASPFNHIQNRLHIFIILLF